MHYSLQWLSELRSSHADPLHGKKLKVDIVHLYKVLCMRLDLMTCWARDMRPPLCSLDVVLVAALLSTDESLLMSVRTAIESSGPLSPPDGLPSDVISRLFRRFPKLLLQPYKLQSFEDVHCDAEMSDLVQRMIASSAGQIDLSLFLCKGVVTGDECLFGMARKYLFIALQAFPVFSPAIDAAMTGLTGPFANNAMLIGETVVDVMKRNRELAQSITDSIMERIQTGHVVEGPFTECSEPEYCLPSHHSDIAIKLSGNLPTLLWVLGCGLQELEGRKAFHRHIDVLLSCGVMSSVEFLEDWLCSLLNVFCRVEGDDSIHNKCLKRFRQWNKVRRSTDDDATKCGPLTVALVKKMLPDASDGEMLWRRKRRPVCQISPDVLNLLRLPFSNDDDGKEKEDSDGLETDDIESLVDLLEDWIKGNIKVDGDFIVILAKHPEYRSAALKLAILYQKHVGRFPLQEEFIDSGNDATVKLILAVEKDRQDFEAAITECSDSILKANASTVSKGLARHVDLISGWVTERCKGDKLWTIKTVWNGIILAMKHQDINLQRLNLLLLSAKGLAIMALENTANIPLIQLTIKSSRTFLDLFEETGLNILSVNFSSSTDVTLLTLKTLQSCTRICQSVCAESKSHADLATHVPPLKKTLESVLFRVKLMLKDNDCLTAFWMGNLRDRPQRTNQD